MSVVIIAMIVLLVVWFWDTQRPGRPRRVTQQMKEHGQHMAQRVNHPSAAPLREFTPRQELHRITQAVDDLSLDFDLLVDRSGHSEVQNQFRALARSLRSLPTYK